MILKDLIARCKAQCPKHMAWHPHEPYGEYFIEDDTQDVQKVLYCVTPTPEVVGYFLYHGYDLLICHHPYLVDVPQLILHTALDCCSGGLNDLWRDALEVKPPYQHFDGTLGSWGRIEPISFQNLCVKVGAFAGAIEGTCWSHSPDQLIESVVICTGLGGIVLPQALATGADCYIVGEMLSPAEESGFKAVIEVGHTRSEWIGVKFFQELLPGIKVDSAPLTLDYFGKEKKAGQRGQAISHSRPA